VQIVPSDDVNAIVRLHRQVYETEYALDASFANGVATRLAELRREGFPRRREGIWLAQLDGRTLGTITLNEENRRLGRLGHLVLLPEARGRGAGLRLADTVIGAARTADYDRLELYTFSDLTAAAALYRRVGFKETSSEEVVRWGRRMHWQRYELAL
jgi:ribosomal protein S18 acetylase RimI-like enzyme